MKSNRRYRRGTPASFICPYCLREFPVDEILFRIEPGGRVVRARRNWFDRLLRRPPRPPTEFLKRGHILEKVCPGRDCGKVLPMITGTEQVPIIGLVGMPGSGMAHHITSLISRLDHALGARFHACVMAADDSTTARFATEFAGPILKNKPLFCSFRGPSSPLIYYLMVSGSLWGEDQPRSAILAFHDMSGQVFDPAIFGKMSVYAGIIVLLDPLQSKGIRELLSPHDGLPDLNSHKSPASFIRRLVDLLENRGVLAGMRRIATPVAFTLPKADVLRDAGLIDPHARWNRPEMHDGYFDPELHRDLENTMRGLFRKYETDAYHNIEIRFDDHAFFGVTSTSCSPDPQTHRYSHVTPWRVEEPLLWLLARLGVIPMR